MKKVKLIQASLMLIAIIATMTFFNSCKRNTIYTNTNVFDNSKTAQATIFGQVIAEDGTPIKDAVVKIGVNSYTTNNEGVFYFSKITTAQRATLITVNKSNYMTGYRTILITPNKDHYTRIMMIELKNPTTFQSISGGMVNVSGGGTITFPTDGIVYKSNGTPYSGAVTVYAKWLDPTGNNINQLMPGDLRAVDGNNTEKILATFGMMGVELFDNTGSALQLASGKTAQLSFPIPASIAMNAPSTIPLWFFDATLGMWKEEGSATKQGSNYVGDVKHFSFWNCDVPNNYVNFDVTLLDNTSSPLANMTVKITNTTTSQYTYGYTNASGFVSGLVPDNATLTLEVVAPSPCSNVIYTQIFTTSSSALSLGTIAITIPAANSYTISGTVLDCFSTPVSNGFVSITDGSFNVVTVPTNSSGAFNATMILCASTATATVTAYNSSASMNNTTTVTLTAGANNLGNLVACGTINEFIHWTSTVGTFTTTIALDEPIGTFNADYNMLLTYVSGYASSVGTIGFQFDGLDNTSGIHNLVSYYDHLDSTNTTFPVTIPVNVTTYQASPGYIEGSFSGVMNGSLIPTRTITCQFRVKRQ